MAANRRQGWGTDIISSILATRLVASNWAWSSLFLSNFYTLVVPSWASMTVHAMQKSFIGSTAPLQAPRRARYQRAAIKVRAGPYDEELIQTAVRSNSSLTSSISAILRSWAADLRVCAVLLALCLYTWLSTDYIYTRQNLASLHACNALHATQSS